MPARIVDVENVGKPKDKRARPLIFDVVRIWHKKMILLSLLQLKSYSQNHLTSREPNALEQGIQYLRFLVLVLSTFGIGIGIGIESIPGLVNGIDPIVNWY